MKCFIHPHKESVAACTKCGKAMCVDCSAFSAHSGICPACRKADMDQEIATLKKQVRRLEQKQKTRLGFSILFFFLIVPLATYPGFRQETRKAIGKLEEKIANIQKSIGFVNQALSRGSGDLSAGSPAVGTVADDNEMDNDAWQCPFCRTINKSGRTCKFCARKRAD